MTPEEIGRPRTSRTGQHPPDYHQFAYQADGEYEPSGSLIRALTYAGFVLGPIVLLSLLAAIVCYVRLLHGPVSLRTFSEHIERGISAELGSFKVRIDDAILTLADDWRVELRLTNVRVTEDDGDLVASSPLAAVDLNPGSLFWLRASPQRVFLIEPRLSLLYSEEQGLIMSFSQVHPGQSGTRAATSPSEDASPPASQTTAVTKTSKPNLPQSFRRVDLARAIADLTDYARRGGAPHLREIGVRNATVVLDYGGKRSEFNLAEGAIGLERTQYGSAISGAMSINSPRGKWMLSFRTDEPSPGALKVSCNIRDLVPRTLSQSSPHLALLEMLDMPVAADLTIDMSAEGEFKGADLKIEAGHGHINLPSLAGVPIAIDSAHFTFAYDAAAQRLKLVPSTIAWGESHVTIEGGASLQRQGTSKNTWHFDLTALDGVLAAEEFGISGVKLEGFTASGHAVPDEGSVRLTQFRLKAGGAEVSAKGEIATADGISSTRVDASMTPMSLPTLKVLWPRAAAPAARSWIGHHTTRGTVQGAKLKLLSGKFLESAPGPRADAQTEYISLTAEVNDLAMVPLPNGLPIEAPRALISLENSSLEVRVPDATLIASPTRRIPLKEGAFTVIPHQYGDSFGELSFRSQTSLAAMIEALNRSKLDLLEGGQLAFEGLDGKVDGQIKITVPLGESAENLPVKTEARARITDVRGKLPGGRFEINGGSIELDVSPIGADAKGELLLNGVLAKLAMQRIFDAPPEMQPPMRLTAVLDNADRTQLGLDLNHLVQGEMAIDIAITPEATGQSTILARADLTNAELVFKDLAWRKPPGRSASLEFEVSTLTPGGMELKNFKIAGDNIAIEGRLLLDAENEVREFYFPSFSLNVVTRLEVEGKLGNDKIWKIRAKGSTFDGRDLFRSLIALGQPSDTEIRPLRPSNGLDLLADIDTVLGHEDLSLRGYKLKLSERTEKLVELEAKGTLDGGKPLLVTLKKDAEGRRLLAESADAGRAFKLFGFYPNLEGGRMRLEVNLDARGAAEKSGILWVEKFRILGDPIVSEVYSSADESSPAIDAAPQGQRRLQREVFDFDRMKVLFSVGHGQFVLEDAYVRGQALGASLRGKVDYNTQRLNLGGTYVPLQGINSALCNIPLVGPIVSGFDCQGVFGITYAIQGPMSRPQVIVNPLSMLTPGILRGIMEMTSSNPEVLPRPAKPKAPVEQRVRSSSSKLSSGETKSTGGAVIDGWSSETAPATKAPGRTIRE